MPAPHILFVKASSCGDILQALPAAIYCRNRFPNAFLAWACEDIYVSMLQNAHLPKHKIPLLNMVIGIRSALWRRSLTRIRSDWCELRRHRFDWLFDLQGNSKSTLITFAANAAMKIGFSSDSVREKINLLATSHQFSVPRNQPVRACYGALVQAFFEDTHPRQWDDQVDFFLSSQEQYSLDSLFGAISSRCVPILCSVDARWPNKRLPADLLLLWLRKVSEAYPEIFWVFVEEQGKQLPEAQMIKRFTPDRSLVLSNLSLALWHGWMKKCAGLLAVDSAALHLGGLAGIPSFSFFGPTCAHIFKPEGACHAMVQGHCPYKVEFPRVCPRLRTCPTQACMRSNSVDELVFSFANWYHRFVLPNCVATH